MGTRPDVASRRSAPSGHVATTTLQRGPFSRCQKVPFLLAISTHAATGGPTPPNTGTPRARLRVHAGRLDATRRRRATPASGVTCPPGLSQFL